MSEINISFGDKLELGKTYYIILMNEYDVGGIYETIEEAEKDRAEFYSKIYPILKAEIVKMGEE